MVVFPLHLRSWDGHRVDNIDSSILPITAGRKMMQTHLTDVKLIKKWIKMRHVILTCYGGQPYVGKHVYDDVRLSFIMLR
jgi:hypothetical protein